MANKNNNNKKNYAGWALATGAAATAGAGAYYLLGPDKKKHQKKAKELVNKIKKEIIEEAKKAKAVGVPAYYRAAEAVSRVYREQYKLHEKDIKAIADGLKNEWQKAAKKGERAVKSKVRKVAKPKAKKAQK